MGAPCSYPKAQRSWLALRTERERGRIWPSTEDSQECVGTSIRSVLFSGDSTNHVNVSKIDRTGDGFYPQYIGVGDTYSPLLTLFPDNGEPPQSFSFVVPAERDNAFSSPYNMDDYASGIMPVSPYAVQVGTEFGCQ
ncbi:MAG: hypothetical protein ACI841_004474 [Planctomycetota bacterium]